MRVSKARASTVTVFLIGVQPLYLPLSLDCTLLLNPIVNLGGVTDGAGVGTIPLPVPSGPGLGGAVIHTQFAIADPAGSALGGITFSNALKVVINDQ